MVDALGTATLLLIFRAEWVCLWSRSIVGTR
jgi:hypothetical protein